MSNIQSILHATVIVADVDKSVKFYCQVLGLTLNPDRPDLGYPGVWFDVGQQQLHLMQVPNPDPVTGRPEHGGRDRHIAFAVADLEALCQRLDDAGAVYTRSKSGRKALFCRDLDGNALEFIEAPLGEHLP
ncbi:glyoxalase [Candidatus Tenderia electrophaga]|jgi:glyoxylase I family protein|uniref:Glyoxalase n=1 Tax=Candidatus Tenderia electrophaga TaxID=1748243 RepID=A0A0S2TE73_9GAMM|nr:glyoxalase [Candidatus Tenderia electrophaga]